MGGDGEEVEGEGVGSVVTPVEIHCTYMHVFCINVYIQ